ncbi:hypothetical protein BH11BAC1_BH11BAC1_23470 [soil metagenome]
MRNQSLGTLKKVLQIFLILHSGIYISLASAQSMLDSCYTSASPSPTFSSSANLIDAADADLLEWTGGAWNGAWQNANITLPPPCNTPPVRAIWVGDSSVWTTGGEAFGLRFSPPIVAGNTYLFFFTYVSVGLGSNGAFAPSVYTNNTGFSTGNFVGQFTPAGFNWETHPFFFTATPAQAGDEYLIIHSFDGSGMVLNFCAETTTDLGDDSLTVCIGDSAILIGGNGFQSYSWNTGETTQSITVHNSGTYISTNQGFCGMSSDTIVVTMDPCGMFPIAVFNTANNHICPGTCTNFTNLSQNASTYLWTFVGATPSTSTDVDPATICYNTPGTYSVQLIATNAITSDTLTLNNFITVYPYPSAQGIIQSGDTLFANQGSASYQWYLDGNLITAATDYFYVAPQSGDYNVVCTDGNNCEVEAAIFDVVAGLTPPEGPGLFNGEGVIVFPNPVVKDLKIQHEGFRTGAAITISIYNVHGEKILVHNCTQCTIDCSLLPAGFYYLEINSAEKIFRTKFIKQ